MIILVMRGRRIKCDYIILSHCGTSGTGQLTCDYAIIIALLSARADAAYACHGYQTRPRESVVRDIE